MHRHILDPELPEPVSRTPVSFVVLVAALGWAVIGEDPLNRAVRGLSLFVIVLIVEVCLRAGVTVVRAWRTGARSREPRPPGSAGSSNG